MSEQDKKEMRDKFDSFLKKHGCFKKFYANEKLNSWSEIDEYDLEIEPEELVCNRFMWDKSPEGQLFWQNISDLWEKELMNK